MSILYCRGCGVDVSGEALFRNISFSMEAGEKAGLVGPNGIGKTTLIRACLGEVPMEAGEALITCSYGYLPQNPLLAEEGTVLESMLTESSDLVGMREQLRLLENRMAENPEEKVMEQYAKLTEEFERSGGYALEAQIRKILSGLGLNDKNSSLVQNLSGGEKTRLALSKLLLRSPELLVLDEPTNHLDIEAIEWLESFLRDYAGTVLVVSHDRYFLDRIASKILHMDETGVKEYPGNFSEYVLQRAVEEKTLAREADRMAKKIARLEEYVRRNQAGVNSKQARGRATQLEKLKPVQAAKHNRQVGISFQASARSGDRTLNIENLGVSFGARKLFRNAQLDLRRGDKVALLGPNGVGKTSFLKAILQKIPYEGVIRLGANVKLGYYSQEHEELALDSTVIDEIRNSSKLLDPEIRTLLARFGFRGEEVFKPVKVLSGGEKSRLALCRLFLDGGNLLLLDEPTNHLDASTREVLEEALEEYDGTLLVVSHDRYFLDRIANRVARLTHEGVTVYEGDYTYYRERLQQEKTLNVPVERVKSAKTDKEEAKNLQRRQKKIQQLEAEIAELEESLLRLEEQMADTEANYERALELHEDYEKTKVLLDGALEAWAEVSE